MSASPSKKSVHRLKTKVRELLVPDLNRTLRGWSSYFNLGWVQDGNITFERRFADNKGERLAEFAADLVRLNFDVILTSGDFDDGRLWQRSAVSITTFVSACAAFSLDATRWQGAATVGSRSMRFIGTAACCA